MKKTVNITVDMQELALLMGGMIKGIGIEKFNELASGIYTKEEDEKIGVMFNKIPTATKQDAIELTAYLLATSRVFID